jgi:hypothetical protein
MVFTSLGTDSALRELSKTVNKDGGAIITQMVTFMRVIGRMI